MARTVDHRKSFNGVERLEGGDIAYRSDQDFKVVASLDLLLIREAWHRGCELEDLADGFGPGEGTHGDWSAIRDSTDEAKSAMLERALNFHFPHLPDGVPANLAGQVAGEVPELLATAQGTSALCGVFRQLGYEDLGGALARRYARLTVNR